MTVITLGVSDLARSTAFYRELFSTPPNTKNAGVTFIQLPGVWLSLFPLDDLAKDTGDQVSLPPPDAFRGFSLGYNARNREEVISIFERAKSLSAHIAKPPQDTFWGGFGCYFADPDGNYWEIVWGPMFEFSEHGDLKFKD